MTLIILIVLLVIVVATMLVLFSSQLKLVQTGQVVVMTTSEMSLVDILQCKVDQFYHNFSFFFHQLAHFSAFYSLLAMRRLVVILRYLLIRAERKFSQMIDAVRGKGVIHKKGAVSLFLTQIKESK